MDSPYRQTNNSFITSSSKIEGTNTSLIKNTTSLSATPHKSNTHGIEKFYLSQHKKDTHREIEFISNRISKLIKSEEKAKKQIQIASQKTDLINQAKERHNLNNQQKEIQREMKKIEEEEQRKKNRYEKERRTENIKAYQEAILTEKKTIAEETKKRSLEYDVIRKQFKQFAEQEKNEKKCIRYNEALQHKHRKGESHNNYLTYLKEEYEKRIKDEKNRHLELINHKKELEKHADEALNRFQSTSGNHVEALKSLEEIAKVSLFHLGLRP